MNAQLSPYTAEISQEPLRIERAALLRAVADAIVASGYAVPLKPKRRYIRRSKQIVRLSQNRLLDYPKQSAVNIALIDDVMRRYRVSRSYAKVMICRARKMRHEAKSRRSY